MFPVKLIAFLCLSILFNTSLFAQKSQTSKPSNATKLTNHTYSYAVFQNEDKTFGYDIFDNGKKSIHQPMIPGRSGNTGFKTKEDAERVAKLAIEKIYKGIMPPTISENELKEMKI